jgi:hypothetical protein
MFRLKRLTAFSAIGISLTLGTYGIAQAATTPAKASGFAAAATAYQNSGIAQALRNDPAGVRVAAGEVEWDGGRVVMLVPASPDAKTNPCPYSITLKWTCVYSRTKFRGTQLQFHDAGSQDLWHFGGRKWVSNSWVNNRWQRAFLDQHRRKPHGNSLCMSPVSTGANSSGTTASHDEWIDLTKNSAGC